MAENVKGVLKPKTFSFKWTVERFFADCQKTGDFHTSPVFPIHYADKVTTWSLQVYPKGNNNVCKDSVSLFLNYENKDEPEVIVDYEMSIENKKMCLSRTVKAKTFPIPGNDWGWRSFVAQDFIKDTQNGALINDTVTITCKVTFDPETKVSDGYNEWLDKIQTGFHEFETLIETNCFSDVTFNVQDKKIQLHKDILMCRNSVFKAMFEHDMKEKKESLVEITDIDYEVMKELFRFIYSGKVENIKKIAKDLLIAADKYSVTQLKALCEKTLYDDLTVDNAIEYLKLTEACDTLLLKRLVIKFVVNNLSDIVRKSDFKSLFADLNREVVCEIIEAVSEKD